MQNASVENSLQLHGLDAEIVSKIFVEMDLKGSGNVAGQFRLGCLDDIQIVHSRTQGGEFTVVVEKKHIHDQMASPFYLCLVKGGAVTVNQFDRTKTVKPGGAYLLDAGNEYILQMDKEVNAIWLRLCRDIFLFQSDQIKLTQAMYSDGAKGLGKITFDLIHNAIKELPYTDESAKRVVRSSITDLLFEAYKIDAMAKVPHLSIHDTGNMRRAKEIIDANLQNEHLNPAFVADKLGISSRHVSALFAKSGWTTMAWISHRRLVKCKEELRRRRWSPNSISQIAFDNGFKNISSFNRSFKEKFGVTPKSIMMN